MKISVIVPTNEVRRPVEGEYCWNNEANSGKGMWQSCLYGALNGLYKIAYPYEIEVPYNADSIRIISLSCCTNMELATIPLPRKKKVKKWQWVLKNIMSTRTKPTYFVSLKHYATSQDAVEDHFNVHAVLRINETEIEVDE